MRGGESYGDKVREVRGQIFSFVGRGKYFGFYLEGVGELLEGFEFSSIRVVQFGCCVDNRL